MNRSHPYKLTATALACLAVALMLVSGARVGAQQGGAKLTIREQRGKLIYVKGESGNGEITALLGTDNLEVPANAFTCANCHGLRGEGTREGGLQPPPINWETLTSKHTSALTRRVRAPYDETTLARAISDGLDPSGAHLHPGMPRYELKGEQMADLIAYLKKLGNEADTDTGLSDETIKVGAALPLSGPLAQVGEDVKATLAAYFAEVNAQGGVYGRRFEFIAEDSRGEPAQTLEATRRLVEQKGVFALVGSFEPSDSKTTNEFLRRSEVALVGPVTLSPRPAVPPNPYVFYLLPTFGDQARVLLDFAASQTNSQATRAPARLAVVYANSDFNADALAGVRTQAKLYSMVIASEQAYEPATFAAARVVGALAEKKPDYVFFFGGAKQFTEFASAMNEAKLSASLLSSVVMVGSSAFALPPAVAERTFLSYPAALPEQNDFNEFITLMQKARVGLRSPAFQAVAFGAAKTLFEATKIGGRQLSRSSLITSLEQLHDFKTGVVPPLTFGPNRRIGAAGSYIVRIDLNKKQYVPLGGRLEPKDRR
ncbi:MAG: ABC transporter substrate-binding protein [Acidobacteria bacterium]|nr:ABC transporter substrate-binding protein [Acidobacteriota bacterium]